MRASAIMFNAGVTLGLALILAGSWIVFGVGPALLGLGVAVWLSTMAASHFAVASMRRGG